MGPVLGAYVLDAQLEEQTGRVICTLGTTFYMKHIGNFSFDF